MKIVIFSQLFYPEVVSINEVASLLVARGHEVTVMTGLPNAPVGKIFDGYGPFKRLKEIWHGVEIRRNWLIPRGSGSSWRLPINYVSFAAFASLMLPRLSGKKPDIIFVNQLSPVTKALPAILYKKITGAPMVMWIHDLWPESVASSGAIKNKRVIGAIGKMVNYIYRHCDLIFVQSKAMNPKIVERGVSPGAIAFLPNPIDTFFVPVAPGKTAQRPEALAQVPQDAFILMFAGSIGRSQDLPTIIAAADRLRQHKDIHWVFVGGGFSQPEAEAMVKKRGLEKCIHFVGSHPIEAMPQFYAAADAMLVTLKNEEIFALTVPLKTQGYLACAKPLICNVPGEAARIINEADAGFTVPPEDPEALADAVRQAYNMRGAQLEAKGRNGRRYFEANYTQEKILDALEGALHKRILNSRDENLVSPKVKANP